MIAPPDPFAQTFDSIEIDPARTPSPEAIERAICLAGEDAPGFYLLDDARGRFVVDRETGVISLSDESWLTREPGAVHVARLRVVEPSGDRYEIEMRLRLTGNVPLMVGAEDLLADAACETAGESIETPPRSRVSLRKFGVPWVELRSHAAPFGAMLAPVTVWTEGIAGASLALGEPSPAPSAPGATWSI